MFPVGQTQNSVLERIPELLILAAIPPLVAMHFWLRLALARWHRTLSWSLLLLFFHREGSLREEKHEYTNVLACYGWREREKSMMVTRAMVRLLDCDRGVLVVCIHDDC